MRLLAVLQQLLVSAKVGIREAAVLASTMNTGLK